MVKIIEQIYHQRPKTLSKAVRDVVCIGDEKNLIFYYDKLSKYGYVQSLKDTLN